MVDSNDRLFVCQTVIIELQFVGALWAILRSFDIHCHLCRTLLNFHHGIIVF